MDQDELRGLVGVYHADGGPIGEARYVLGRILGTAHCGLCDITHSPVRRKPAWDRMVAHVGVQFDLLHLNEMPADVAAATATHGSPAVLARLRDGSLHLALDAAALDAARGSVEVFAAALRQALAANGWLSGRAPAEAPAGSPGGGHRSPGDRVIGDPA